LILISGIYIYSGYIKNIEQEFAKIIDEISDSIIKNHWDEANKKNEKLNALWDKCEKKLAMFNDHGDLDEIELEIADLNKSIFYTDAEHAQKAVEKITILFKRLVKNESFSLENILKSAHDRLSCHIML